MNLNVGTRLGITIGQLLAIIGIITSVFFTYTDVLVRISNIEQKTKEFEITFKRNEEIVEKQRIETREDIKEINNKIDIIIYKLEKK